MASFSSSDDDGDVDWNAKGTTTKTKSKQNQQKRRVKKAKVEEKEEGEVEDDDDDQFDDGYDENLMGDEEDQRRLAQMTEKEREQELFNRSEKRERMRTRFEIERKLRLAKKKELEKLQEQKRQRLRASDIYSDSDDDSSSDEDSSPTHHHNSNHHDHHSAPATRNSTANNNNNTTTPNSGGLSNDDDSHGDNDSDDEQSDREDEEEVEEFDIKLPDLKSVQLKRDMIEEWCHAPFFKSTAIGLFVKISVGNHPQTKGHVYKVAQIIDVIKTPKAYNLGKTRTDKGAVLKLGRIERTYQMLYISNSPFDENDLLRWKEQMQNDNCDLPGREHFSRKKQDLFNAINYEYKDADIEAMLAEKNRFKETPYNFAMRKTKLMADKADAELDGNHALALKIQQEIDMVEEKAKQQEKLRSSSTFSAISFVNERNRLRNIAEAEKVLMESKNVRTEDPFTRRKCTPTIVHKFSKNNMLPPNGAGMSPSSTPTDSPSNNTSIKKEDQVDGRNGNVNTVGATPLKSATDLFAAHDDIELDLDLELSV